MSKCCALNSQSFLICKRRACVYVSLCVCVCVFERQGCCYIKARWPCLHIKTNQHVPDKLGPVLIKRKWEACASSAIASLGRQRCLLHGQTLIKQQVTQKGVVTVHNTVASVGRLIWWVWIVQPHFKSTSILWCVFPANTKLYWTTEK